MSRVLVRTAKLVDVPELHRIGSAAAADLVERFGPGHWSIAATRNTLELAVRERTLYAIEREKDLVGTFRLTDTKIRFYEKSWFSDPNAAAAYLLDMAIEPRHQHGGVGRRAIEEVERIARSQKLTAVRLDAYDSDAGAGPFYRKCGFEVVHRGTFKGARLEYYEKVLREKVLRE